MARPSSAARPTLLVIDGAESFCGDLRREISALLYFSSLSQWLVFIFEARKSANEVREELVFDGVTGIVWEAGQRS